MRDAASGRAAELGRPACCGGGWMRAVQQQQEQPERALPTSRSLARACTGLIMHRSRTINTAPFVAFDTRQRRAFCRLGYRRFARGRYNTQQYAATRPPQRITHIYTASRQAWPGRRSSLPAITDDAIPASGPSQPGPPRRRAAAPRQPASCSRAASQAPHTSCPCLCLCHLCDSPARPGHEPNAPTHAPARAQSCPRPRHTPPPWRRSAVALAGASLGG